jgi:Fic-DOC domain mobile mystery protein B
MSFDDIFSEPSGSTPLDEEEKEELIPKTITIRDELNAEEESNILSAAAWLASSQLTMDRLLTTKHLMAIHKRMFDRVWKWAGKFRHSNKSIGIPWWEVPTQLQSLCQDTLAQLQDISATRWSNDEIAVRFHHRLVLIHPFPNGNGRHARLVTEKLLTILGESECTWGRSSLHEDGQAREQYVASLRAADNHDYSLLLSFVRS